MSAFLPVAGISVSILLLIAIGALVGFLSGLLGVGGGVLLTPILMMIGIRPSVAAASGVNAIVATSSSGLAAHFRLGNVDLKLGSVLLLGGVGGASLGVQIIKVLRALGIAGFVITVTYIVVLGGAGVYMLIEGIQTLRSGAIMPKSPDRVNISSFFRKLPLQMSFPSSGVRHSVLVPILLCTLVGILTAIMGVGGGFLIVPMMTGLLQVPVRVAVGTSLFQILFTSVDTTFLQAVENHTVDIEMALHVGAGFRHWGTDWRPGQPILARGATYDPTGHPRLVDYAENDPRNLHASDQPAGSRTGLGNPWREESLEGC